MDLASQKKRTPVDYSEFCKQISINRHYIYIYKCIKGNYKALSQFLSYISPYQVYSAMNSKLEKKSYFSYLKANHKMCGSNLGKEKETKLFQSAEQIWGCKGEKPENSTRSFMYCEHHKRNMFSWSKLVLVSSFSILSNQLLQMSYPGINSSS